MIRAFIKLALAVTVITCSSVYAETPAVPAKEGTAHHTILMFGASWCAPCIAELRHITALASGANPDRIVVAWSDGGIRRYGATLPGNVEIASRAEAQQMVRRYALGVYGLPYSVMIDGQGRKCAEFKAGLTPEAISQMRATCVANSH